LGDLLLALRIGEHYNLLTLLLGLFALVGEALDTMVVMVVVVIVGALWTTIPSPPLLKYKAWTYKNTERQGKI